MGLWYSLDYSESYRGVCPRFVRVTPSNNSRSSQTIQIGQKNNQEVLNRGDVIKAPDEADGRTYKFVSGCGNVYLNVTWDKDGNINQTFTNKGSSGTCRSNQEAVSRLISLALRGGIPIEKIIDQLESVDICPAYTVARAKGKKVSKGASCPHAIANILKKAINDVQVKVNKSQNEQLVENKIDNVQDKNICPECGSSITQAEGCVLCKNCGWSKCD